MNNPVYLDFSERMRTTAVILAVGEGDGETIIWLDERAAPETLAPVYAAAASVENGERVRFILSKPFKAFADTTIRHRPSPSGVSMGHYRITAGTQGFVADDIATGKKVVVSNAHIIWDINNARPNDPILQPGPIDGGRNPQDVLARALRSIPISSSGNTADAAIALVEDPWEEFVSQEILNLGFTTGVANAFVGEQICGSGRTTSNKALPERGTIIVLNATVKVDYGSAGTKTFVDCAISDIFSQPGDSGTAMLDFFTRAVIGLLFAGGGGYTIICQQKNFMERLGIRISSTPFKLYSGSADASHWNTPSGTYEIGDEYFKANVDGLSLNFFQNLVDQGFEVVVLKLCQPGFGKDPKFDEYYGYAREVGLEVMAYIYVDPNYSIHEHFNLFVSSLGGRVIDGPPALDCEEARARTPAQITETLKGLSQLLETWYQLSKPYIYTSISWWKEHVLPWMIDGVDIWSLHPYWDAWWSKKAIFPEVAYSWVGIKGEPDMWQVGPYKMPGFAGLLDCNIIFPRGQKLRKSAGPPPETVNLSLTIAGHGAVTPPGGSFPKGQTIHLRAAPDVSWRFESWGGDVTSSSNPLNLVMDSDKHIVANFSEVAGTQPAEFTTKYNKGIAQVDGQNVRSGPSTKYSSIGGLKKGQTVKIFEKAKDSGGNDWVQIAVDEYSGKVYWAAQFHQGTLYIDYVLEEV